MRKDKIYHFVISLFIAVVIFAIASDYISELKSGAIAFIITLLIGIGKEIYDIKTTGFSWYDLLADFTGTICGVIIGILLI